MTLGNEVGGVDEYTCREVAKVLQAYLDGEVDDAAARKVAVHVDACIGCGHEAETFRRIADALARRRPNVDRDVLARLQNFGERLASGEAPAD